MAVVTPTQPLIRDLCSPGWGNMARLKIQWFDGDISAEQFLCIPKPRNHHGYKPIEIRGFKGPVFGLWSTADS